MGNSAGAELLRNRQGDQFIAKLLLGAIALFVGVGGIWLLFTGASTLVERLRPKLRDRILPWVFVAPALLLLAVYLVYPAVATVIRSFQDDEGAFTLDNWASLGTGRVPRDHAEQRDLAGRRDGRSASASACSSPRSSTASSASRWRRSSSSRRSRSPWSARRSSGGSCTHTSRPANRSSASLNAIWTAFGNEPVPWATTFPVNIPAEILIMIWLQTGFAMVVLSAAIKGVSVEVLEAARLDGASERQTFFQVIVPLIRGSIVTVATTIGIATLKIFDIVYSLSGGRNHDSVVAVRMYQEMFQFFNDGRAAALATVLFIAVLPVMVLNLRNFRRQQAM